MTNERFNAEKVSPTGIDAAHIFSLNRMRKLAAHLGNPQNSYPTVHVAGSKGKGSICEMTASGLQGLGHRIGLYTSPDLLDIRERIRINGEMIPQRNYAALISNIEAIISTSSDLQDVTHFERLTCLAFEYFRQCAVDAAVIEVGLGGQDDATNIIVPAISILGSIQLEHTQLLGNTLAEIASVKAGIMKMGVPTVSVPQSKEVLSVFHRHAARVGSELQVLGSQIVVEQQSMANAHTANSDPIKQTAGCDTPDRYISLNYHHTSFNHVPVPLEGHHQAMNCAAALCAIATISSRLANQCPPQSDSYHHIDQLALCRGLHATPRHGRFEVIESRAATFVLDTAHTPDSVRSLLNSINHRFPQRSLITIFAVASDKDFPEILRLIGIASAACICTRAANHERGEPSTNLAASLNTLRDQTQQLQSLIVSSAISLNEAIASALSLLLTSDEIHPVILITGSHAIVGEAIKQLRTP